MSLRTHAAQSGGTQDYPEYLLQANQQVNEVNVGLFKAALAGSVSECEHFIRQGAKPNFFFRPEDQKNSLHVAAEHGFLDVVKLLLKNGAEPNSISTADQSSALTLAAHNNDPNLIKVLMDHGASINHGNGYGNTALHEACRCGNGATINSLLEHGADIHVMNHKGSTPLHIFCYGNPKTEVKNSHSRATCEVLLQNGASVSAVDSRGTTPLMVCAATGRIDLIELLISQGADLHARDSSGQTARDIAIFYSQEETAKYLASQGL